MGTIIKKPERTTNIYFYLFGGNEPKCPLSSSKVHVDPREFCMMLVMLVMKMMISIKASQLTISNDTLVNIYLLMFCSSLALRRGIVIEAVVP